MTPPGDTYGGRYTVLEHLGSGGMAEVYRARDELLGREVALKVLSSRLAGDRAFVERFRREAQSAANLSHPNIVSLYDYGSDDDSYFIVMEFIDGRSLADVISSGPLLPERAAEIAAQVAKALSRAHAAGIVHRDIKPGNIMITRNGETKVTDFGIARALTRDGDQTMTQTGMVMGTAAYLSPEQAQGNPVDARSDVYSLGCVLYEMLTGEPPFTGDTPLAIAYKHVRENPRPPSAVNPEVSPALDAIVMKSLAKNPENRFSSAAEMHEDLQRFLSGERVKATPVMADDTMVAAPPVTGTRVMREVDIASEPERRRGGWYALAALAILAIFAVVAWLLWNNLIGAEEITVPDVVGENVDDAREILEQEGFEVDVENRASRKPVDEVIAQDPEAGEGLEEGGTVVLTVSIGPRETSVPDVNELPLDEAERELKDADLRVGEVTREASEEVEEDSVISQSIAPGTTVDAGTKVDLVVSTGPESVTVPFVEGQTEDQAVAEIEEAGLVADVQRQPDDDVEEGVVIEQDPDGGSEATAGDVVTILVSEGSEEQPMPDVTGEDGDEAEEFLEADFGLDVTQVEESVPGCVEPPGRVCAQDPEPGTPVSEGDDATLFIQPGGAGLPGRSLHAGATGSFFA